MKKIILNTSLVIGSVFMTLIVIDVLFRLISPEPDLKNMFRFFMYDEDLGVRPRPNYSISYRGKTLLRMNSHGLRDYEYPYVKTDEKTRRIFAVGDSFTFGTVDLRNNFLKVLETKLNNYCKNNQVEVINGGVPWYGTKHELVFLRKYGLRYKPDLVLVTFFIGNDITDNHPSFSIPVKSLLKTGGVYSQFRKSYWLWFYQHSHLARYLINKLSLYQHSEHGKTFPDSLYFGIEKNRMKNSRVVYDGDLYMEEAWEATKMYIRGMKQLSLTEGFDILFVIAPDDYQVNKWIQSRIMDMYQLDDSRYDFSQPQARLREYFEELDIRYIDLLPDFLRKSEYTNLYNPNDTHWNRDGNSLAAEIIFRRIVSPDSTFELCD